MELQAADPPDLPWGRPRRSIVRRKATVNLQVLAQHDPRRFVDVQYLDGDLARLGLANERGVFPAEMAHPVLLSGIEQWIELSREKAGEVWPLCPVAFRAGVTECVRIVGAAMLHGDDVLNMKGQEVVVVFVQAAVLTAAAGPLANEGPESGVHHSRGEWARSCRAFDLRMATKVL